MGNSAGNPRRGHVGILICVIGFRAVVVWLSAVPAWNPPQDKPLQHVVSVINIEVSVRVFKGDAFADYLTINDFEVSEDGKPQRIEAVYLIDKAEIRREEGLEGSVPRVQRPELARQFVLFFDMSDYLAEVDRALDYFFANVILPEDSLIVVTPMNQYRMRPDVLNKKRPAEIKRELADRLRRDILLGSSEYRATIDTLYKILDADPNGEFGGINDPAQQLQLYATTLSKLEALRKVDEKSLLQFAEVLKSLPGQKYVYLLHQMETIPQFSPQAVAMKMLERQDDLLSVFAYMENFDFNTKSFRFDVEAVKKAYADSSITVHFLFITKRPAERLPITAYKNAKDAMDPRKDVAMVEHSEDIFSAFSEVARATGGLSETSADAAAAFEKAVQASERYYLIYYRPNDYRADGKFHEIRIKVKAGGYRIFHRAGYFAN